MGHCQQLVLVDPGQYSLHLDPGQTLVFVDPGQLFVLVDFVTAQFLFLVDPCQFLLLVDFVTAQFLFLVDPCQFLLLVDSCLFVLVSFYYLWVLVYLYWSVFITCGFLFICTGQFLVLVDPGQKRKMKTFTFEIWLFACRQKTLHSQKF